MDQHFEASSENVVQDEGLKDKAARSVQQLADKATDTARSRLEAGKNTAANTLHRVANTLQQSGTSLRSEEQNMAGEYLERAAQQIEKAAQYVRDAELGEMVDRVEDFARRQPAVFVGAAFALGLLGARFLKSSQRNRNGEQQQTHFTDREVPAPVAHEDFHVARDAETWQGHP
jgi:hypothetical protein